MSAAAVASIAAAGAVALLAGAPSQWGQRPAGRAARFGPAVIVLVAVVAAPRAGVLVLLGSVLAVVAAVVVGRRRRDRQAAETAQRLVEACELLASELTAGRPPALALERVARDWTVLAPVVEAERVGLGVPDALRAVSLRPGAGQLRMVAAAWQVAHSGGGGMASALDRIAVELREALGAQRVVEGELASARATARLVALLPLAALVMGSGVGGDPWHFLLRTPIGLACLAAGGALGGLGLCWIDAIARGAVRR